MPQSELFRAIPDTRGEGTVETTGLHDVPRLYGFAPLTDEPGQSTYIAVGIPTAAAFTDEERSLITNLIAWVGSDRLLERPLLALSTAACQLAHGNLGVRTGLAHDDGELGQLARAFDHSFALQRLLLTLSPRSPK